MEGCSKAILTGIEENNIYNFLIILYSNNNFLGYIYISPVFNIYMAIYVVTVTSGREDIVAEIIAEEAKRKNLAIYSIVHFSNMKGFLFVEAENQLEVAKAIHELRYAKKVLPEEVKVEEILRFFEEKEEIVLNIGDIVEIIAGPLKGTKAKVLKVDNKKKEVLLELLDVPVPINVDIPINNVKLLYKKEETK
ncbi:MAG: transcription elongation factor Spt5 [Nanopusillaceae archaeon]